VVQSTIEQQCIAVQCSAVQKRVVPARGVGTDRGQQDIGPERRRGEREEMEVTGWQREEGGDGRRGERGGKDERWVVKGVEIDEDEI
jgi:hypothetical protein